MRIAYACYWNLFAADGVTAKIDSQVRAWRAAGHEAQVFCLSPAPVGQASAALDAVSFVFSDGRTRIAETRRLARAVEDHDADVVYLRYDVFVPPFASPLRARPSAVELNTDDRAEWRLRSRRARAYNAINRRATLRAAGGLVCVTRALAAGMAGLRKPTTVIANGIDLEAIPEVPPRVANERPTLVFLVGADVPWHGLDKVLWLAEAMPAWEFALVGVDAARVTAAPNVTLHPPLPPHAYHEILARADVGIGTLALHRKGMDEASPLKVREYLAAGLPVVLAYEDTDLAESDPWFVLRLPNTEPNLREGLDRVRAFVESVRGRRVAREEVAGLIDSAAKERERLRFLERLQAPGAAASSARW
jgi:glycosyltransferase involved in cell wall biosynthesis